MGPLVYYNIQKKQIVSSFSGQPVTSSVLKYIRNGDQVVVSSYHKSPQYRSLLILDSDSLDLLHCLPIIPTCSDKNIVPLYSICESRIALLMWKKYGAASSRNNRSEPERNSVSNKYRCFRHLSPMQVAIYKLDVGVSSLKQLAQRVVYRHVHSWNMRQLPLPRAIVHELTHCVRY